MVAAVAFAPVSSAQDSREADLWPWQTKGTADSPPEVKPFQIPTFEGSDRDFKEPPQRWVKAPKIDGDAIFKTVIACYPARSRWQIDIDLQAQVRNTQVVDVTNSTIGRNMVGIVMKMPLYSDTEMDRERQRELQRRQQTAGLVSNYISGIAKRNAAVRSLAITGSMERRAQIRVDQGIADGEEQIRWLERTVSEENKLIQAETDIQESRLKLVAQCREDIAEEVNSYLTRLSVLPGTRSR
jgi:hypothetical protein